MSRLDKERLDVDRPLQLIGRVLCECFCAGWRWGA
jgi:hypothetical protein